MTLSEAVYLGAGKRTVFTVGEDPKRFLCCSPDHYIAAAEKRVAPQYDSDCLDVMKEYKIAVIEEEHEGEEDLEYMLVLEPDTLVNPTQPHHPLFF